MKNIVIFDFDGTLADSMDLFISSLNRLSYRFKYNKIGPKDVDVLRHKNSKQILKYLGISFLKFPFVLKHLRREMNKGIAQTRPISGIKDILVNLKKNECKIGILTSNSEQNVKEFLIKNDLDVFDFIHSGTSIFGKGKILESIIQKNKFAKEKTFYIGDEIRDIDASKKARVRMIAVTWGMNAIEALQKKKPDHIAKTPQEILDVVLRTRKLH